MLTKRTTLLAVFFAVSTISTILLVISTLNYLEFYKAIEQMKIEISDVTLFIEPDNVEVTLNFTIENPTRYADLKLRDLSWSLYFYDENAEEQLLWADSISYYDAPLPIDPYWAKSLEYQINLSINRDVTQRLLKTHNEQQNINWRLSASAIVISFVDTLDVPMSATYP